MMNEEKKFKVIVIGDSNVGKSSILEKYDRGTFKEESTNTIGVDYLQVKQEINKTSYNLQIWDTAGQERFRAVTRGYYRDSYAVIFVFDVTNEESLDNIEGWIKNYKESTVGSNPLMLLIGNKYDLKNNLNIDKVKFIVAQNGISTFIQTSAKTGHNIDTVFHYILKRCMLHDALGSQNVNLSIARNTKSCCS